MAKRVKLPDGKYVNVPDDASLDEIEAFINDYDAQSRPTPPVTTPVATPPIAPITPSVAKPAERGWLGKAWDFASTPLTTAPKEFATSVANSIDKPSLNRSPMMARIAGFGAGALEGLGDVVSQMTSPIDLATTVLTGGSGIAAKRGLGTIARGLNTAAKIPAAGMVAHGGGTVIDPNSTWGERGMGLAEMAGGIAGVKQKVGKIADTKPTTVPKGWDLKDMKAGADIKSAASSAAGDFAKAKQVIQSYEGSLAKHVNKTDAEIIAYAEAIEPGFAAKPGRIRPVAGVDFNVDPASKQGAIVPKDKLTKVAATKVEGDDVLNDMFGPPEGLPKGDEGLIASAESLVPDFNGPSRKGPVTQTKLALYQQYIKKTTEAGKKPLEYNDWEKTPNLTADDASVVPEIPPVSKATTDSAAKLQKEKAEYDDWVKEEQSNLAEGETFVPPPNIQRSYEAKMKRLAAVHEKNVAADAVAAPVTPAAPITDKTNEFVASVKGELPPIAPVAPVVPKPVASIEVPTSKVVPAGNRPTNIKLRPPVKPETMKRATAEGYEFSHVNEDGTVAMKYTGKKNAPVLEGEVGVSKPQPRQAQLQQDLRGAAPRFRIGPKEFIPKFKSDLDKALYIIAQKTPSKRDKDYLRFVMEQTGMSESVARSQGQNIRQKIRLALNKAEEGEVEIEQLFQPQGSSRINPATANDSPMAAATPPPPPPPPKPNKPADSPDGPDGPDKGIEGEIEDIPERDSPLGPATNRKKQGVAAEIYNFSRGLMSSLDFSAPLRQGKGLIHKKGFREALPAMFKAWATEDGFQAVQDAIANRALFKKRIGKDGKELPSFAEQAGLQLTDMTNVREEALVSTWAEYVPGVRRSNRAYTAFLNKLRADTFEELVKSGKIFGADAQVNLKAARELAEFVNVASGRGPLKGAEKAATILNQFFFSPRLIASRLQMLNPYNYIFHPNKQVRKEYLKSAAAIAAFGNVTSQLAKLIPGAEVNNNPNSSDFGKMKIGDVRIDPYAGHQQYIVAMNRLLRPAWAKVPGLEKGTDTGFVPLDTITGYLGTGGQQVKSSNTGKEYDLWNDNPGPYDPTHMDVAQRFIRGKAHPLIGFAWSLMSNKTELSGKKMNFESWNPIAGLAGTDTDVKDNAMNNSIVQRFVPIIAQDLFELSQEEPTYFPFDKTLLAIPAAFGEGVQSYSKE